MQLYRPVGPEELALIERAAMRAFPPRLPEQPIFYPVLDLDYARQIARDWNAQSGARVGHVTTFEIDDAYAARFPVQQAGARHHRELWVPAEELGEFNRHLLGPIVVIETYRG